MDTPEQSQTVAIGHLGGSHLIFLADRFSAAICAV